VWIYFRLTRRKFRTPENPFTFVFNRKIIPV
jgi:hypothetical protein